jgi:hypothetical protein
VSTPRILLTSLRFFIPTDMPQGPAGVIVFKVGKPDNQLVAFSAFSASR